MSDSEPCCFGSLGDGVGVDGTVDDDRGGTRNGLVPTLLLLLLLVTVDGSFSHGRDSLRDEEAFGSVGVGLRGWPLSAQTSDPRPPSFPPCICAALPAVEDGRSADPGAVFLVEEGSPWSTLMLHVVGVGCECCVATGGNDATRLYRWEWTPALVLEQRLLLQLPVTDALCCVWC